MNCGQGHQTTIWFAQNPRGLNCCHSYLHNFYTRAVAFPITNLNMFALLRCFQKHYDAIQKHQLTKSNNNWDFNSFLFGLSHQVKHVAMKNITNAKTKSFPTFDLKVKRTNHSATPAHSMRSQLFLLSNFLFNKASHSVSWDFICFTWPTHFQE